MPYPLKRPRVRDHGPKGELDQKFAESPGRIGNARELRASYAGKVTLIDDQIGKILKEIETRGEWDRTIILFTSDHGEMNGDYDLIHKSNFLNPAAHSADRAKAGTERIGARWKNNRISNRIV